MRERLAWWYWRTLATRWYGWQAAYDTEDVGVLIVFNETSSRFFSSEYCVNPWRSAVTWERCGRPLW